MDASSSLASSEDDRLAVCYLCLDTGADEPLRRDCACRDTDAGLVHLSCLTEYAAAKSKQALDMNQFSDPWRLCPGCHQEYQNELAVGITSEFVSFVRKQYPRDTERQVESLHLKMHALDSMLERLQPRQKRELRVTANLLLSLIERMKHDAPLSKHYSWVKSSAYNAHGRIALNEGSEESARRAVIHLENQLEVNESIGDDEGIAHAKASIAIAKSLYEGGSNIEEVLKVSQELYELRIAQLGGGDKYTIDAGKNYAIDLRDANRGDEARELLTKLLITSKQVLGPRHNTTKEIETEFEEVIEVANED